MKHLSFAAMALVSALALIPLPALAAHGDDHSGAPGHAGAPAPLLGASIPGLAIGYGVYWLLRRRQKSI